MRRAVATLLAAVAAVAAAPLLAQGQDTRVRATAIALSSYGDAETTATNDEPGTTTSDDLPSPYAADGIAIQSGSVQAIVADDGTATANVKLDGIDLLGGRITMTEARRSTTVLASGRVRSVGAVDGLVVDGTSYGTRRGAETIRFDGGELRLNDGPVGVHLDFDTGDSATAQDLDLAVARASRREIAPSPTPRPTDTPDPRPTPTATATKTPQDEAKRPRRDARQRALERAARTRFKEGSWTFPVLGDARTADNYGAARAKPIVTHEGVDIFAPFGDPVVAVQDGTLSLVGTLPISGNRLWLTTTDGDAFFYAHLSAFAPIAENGAKVEAGEVLGYTGNTGDAEPTPPHVHFEIHPGGEPKPSIDPYPIVTRWQEAAGGTRATSTDRPGSLVTVKDFLAP